MTHDYRVTYYRPCPALRQEHAHILRRRRELPVPWLDWTDYRDVTEDAR